jgi:ferredoxin-NADP reductase
VPETKTAPTGGWQTARVLSLTRETPRAKTITLGLSVPTRHLAGQHYVVRLTAPDGYTASRSYSVASPPDDTGEIDLTVERLDDGEVSTFLHEVVEPGDELEVRGPIGGYFVWDAGGTASPLLLAAGGSGIVPLRSILRHRERAGATVPARLLYSVRSLPDVIYRDEIDRYASDGVSVTYALTRNQPPGWTGHRGRVDSALLADVAWPKSGGPVTDEPVAYVCGPTAFVESIAEGLTKLGYAPRRVKTERFGGAGGP